MNKNNRKLVFQIDCLENILDYKFSDGSPVWLHMRNRVNNLISERDNNQHSCIAGARRETNVICVIVNLIKSVISNFVRDRHFKGREIVAIPPSRINLEDGIYTNRYIDLYSNQLESKMVCFENLPTDWELKKPRRFDNVLYYAHILVAKMLLGRVFFSIQFKDDYLQARKLIQYIQPKLQDCGVSDIEDIELEMIAKETIIYKYAYTKMAKWLLRKVPNCKVLIVSNAPDPKFKPLISLAKRKGIKTIDLQHGAFSKYDPIYNYSDALVANNEVRWYLADSFFAYGLWWTSQTNLYQNHKIIGNAFREKTISRLVTYDKKTKKNRILIVGCAENTNDHIILAENLQKEYPSYEIVFRPHPLETAYAVEQGKIQNVFIEIEKELYESLSSSEYVISSGSTVLFEAIGIVSNILVWDTSITDTVIGEYPFKRFSTWAELIQILEQCKSDVPHNMNDEMGIWQINAVGNFNSAMEDILSNTIG